MTFQDLISGAPVDVSWPLGGVGTVYLAGAPLAEGPSTADVRIDGEAETEMSQWGFVIDGPVVFITTRHATIPRGAQRAIGRRV